MSINVTDCKITQSWPLKAKPLVKNAKFYYPRLQGENNTLLGEIISNYSSIRSFYDEKPNGKLGIMIFVDGNRYVIRPLQITTGFMLLEQYFMHYNNHQGKLLPVSVRYDSIKFRRDR